MLDMHKSKIEKGLFIFNLSTNINKFIYVNFLLDYQTGKKDNINK